MLFHKLKKIPVVYLILQFICDTLFLVDDLTETLKESMRKRLPWLFILLRLGMCVSAVVGIFEHVVEQLTLIMAFQSLILGMAGNVGTQSLAVTIRVLTDENLTAGDKRDLVLKEMRAGFCNGLILGIISFFSLRIRTMLRIFPAPCQISTAG